MDLGLLIPQMLEATLVTLKVFFLTLLFSLPLGLIVAFGRMSRGRRAFSGPSFADGRIFRLLRNSAVRH